MKEQQCSVQVQQPPGTSLSCYRIARLVGTQMTESDMYQGTEHYKRGLTTRC